MPSRCSPVVVTSVLWLAVCPAPAQAQAGTFLASVRELAETTLEAGTNASRRTAAALNRMTTALEEWDRGIATLETRIDRDLEGASRERAFQLHIELGLAYRQRGRLDEALRQFDAAAAVLPTATDVHLLRALTLEAAGNTRDAGRAFQAAWTSDAASPVKAYFVLRRTTDLDAADRERARKALRDTYERIISTDKRSRGAPFLTLDPVPDTLSRTPVVGDAAVAGVFARLAEGRLDDAVAAFRGSGGTPTATDDDSPLAHFVRGRTDEIDSRRSDARREYAAALAGTLAGRHVLYVGIGRLAQVEGELDAAIEAFGHAVRLNPNDPVIHRELAAAYAAADRFDDAFVELVAALLIDPGDAEALAAIGQLYLDADRAADAIPALSRALQVMPDRYGTHYALAVALSRVGRTEDAAREFERFERMSRQALEHRRREVTGQVAPEEVKR